MGSSETVELYGPIWIVLTFVLVRMYMPNPKIIIIQDVDMSYIY